MALNFPISYGDNNPPIEIERKSSIGWPPLSILIAILIFIVVGPGVLINLLKSVEIFYIFLSIFAIVVAYKWLG